MALQESIHVVVVVLYTLVLCLIQYLSLSLLMRVRESRFGITSIEVRYLVDVGSLVATSSRAPHQP